MRLDFRILWFENQPDDVKTQMEEITSYLEDVGFIPHIEIQPNGADIEVFGRQQELFDEYDLVVVDYDLGVPEQNGDWVAKQARRHFGFTDIIFYSGKRPDELRKMVYDSGIDGVYCFSRPTLADKLAIHIDQVVRRLSRLEAMRGLAMGIVGRCDDELRALLLHAYDAGSEEDKNLLTNGIDEIVSAGRDSGQKQYEASETFQDRLESRSVTSFTLYKLALKYLKNREDCADKRKVLVDYNPDVLDKRNMMAHALERRTENGWVVESNAKPAITVADFPALRKSMAFHLENIREISATVGALATS